MVEPFLRYVLEGRKSVESRFSVYRIAPYHRVTSGDVILLKKCGGPLTGICYAAEVWYYQLDPASWKEIREEFTQALCAQDPDFWHDREAASYATLISLRHVQRLPDIHYSKRDRRGWVVLQEHIASATRS
ncbi:MAG: ASCH domain-containing protein [Chloroflexota bacterium]|nr:ASCH domain-containing protein [Chloroflexota bacterium]